ncbi:uncharacterized protein [Henckelia pumila]|uniref:uncharacterized protein n=1 Tax=Henckelia pumila TaxID=405737 RepID=UPI003C6E0AB0
MVGSMKFDIEKFTGNKDFSLWRIKMRAILIQQGLMEALKKKEEIPLREVAREESAVAVWLKLENLYMTKSLANQGWTSAKRFSRKERKAAEKPKEDGTLAVATNGYDSAEVLVVSKGNQNHECILDLGCSFHMCPIKSWFEKLEEADQGMRNLLYVLQGDTIIGSTTSIQEQHDRTKLWHLRLGHVSEKGLHELSKQGLLGGDKIESLELRDSCALGKSKRVSFGQGNKFVKLCKEKDITRHRTVAGTSQQNGLAENRTLLERVRYGKDSQISVNDKLPIEVESFVLDEESDEMQDDDMKASDPKEDLIAEEVEYSEPNSYNKAMTSKQKNKWIEAMNEEMNSLEKNQTWKLLDLELEQMDVKTAFLHGDLE